MRALPPFLALLSLSGCAHYGLGVTPGGVQDMNHARQLIAEGIIPSEADYTAEGLFSEHDLPLEGEACEDLLCPRTASAWTDPADGVPGEVLVQVGFDTVLDSGSFERPVLDLAVAIDVSGSMTGEKIDLSRKALHEMVDQLGPRDTMSLVSYGSRAKLRQRAVRADEPGKRKLHAAIDGLKASGSTAMEKGMTLAYDQLDSTKAASQASKRLLVVTDAQPNVGATGPDSFLGMARRHSDDTGLTVWGVGLDLGAELTHELSTIRGGNAYVFLDVADMQETVRDEFDFMVTPLAYDLDVELEADPSLEIHRVWGSVQEADRIRAHIGAATLFPSTREGGLGISLLQTGTRPILQQPELDALGTLTLSWTPVDGGQRVTTTVDATWPGEPVYADDWAHSDQAGPFRMAALVDELLALDAAAAWCAGDIDKEAALSTVTDVAHRLTVRAGADRDADLQVEADLMDALRVLVEADAPCNAPTETWE